MKKLTVLLFVFLLVLSSIMACSGQPGSQPAAQSTTQSTAQPLTQPVAQSTTTGNTSTAASLVESTSASVAPVTAVSETSQFGNEDSETRTIVDTMGREVTVKKNVESIIAIPWPWTSFVFAVDGSADKIMSMSQTALDSYKNCMFQVLAPGLGNPDTGYMDDKNPDGGSFGTLNIEELAKINPDLVIIYKRDADKMLPILESAQIPTVVFDFGGLKEVQDGMMILGEILGEQQLKNAQTNAAWHHETDVLLQERLGSLTEDEKPSVLHLSSGDLRLNNSGFNNNMILQSGGVNAAIGEDGKLVSGADANFEQILRWDPDYIILGNFADHKPDEIYDNIMANQDWSQLKAVKNKHVYKIPMGLYRWDAPNTEAHLLLRWQAKLLHPELLADVKLEEKIQEFYKVLFDHTVTEEELDMIFHADLNARSAAFRE